MTPKTEEAPPADDVTDSPGGEEWEDVKVGLGKEWDFGSGVGEDSRPLVAFYIDTADVTLENDPDRDTARAQLFALADTGEQVFLWDSYELSTALEQVNTGDKVRITFLGRDSFTGQDGPRQVKRYKVQRARAA